MSDLIPTILGTASIPSAKNIAFGHIQLFTYGNLVQAKPDFYDGAYPAQIDKPIREKLAAHIMPATQGQAPTLPNFFPEVRGPNRNPATAKRQACSNGVLSARGIYELRLFETEPTLAFDDNSYIITSTYHNGQLKM